MGLEKEDTVISEFLKSLSSWCSYIVIGGGFALFIYKLYLTDQELKNPPVGTRDIDSLIPRKISKKFEKDIATQLKEAGFEHKFKDLLEPPTEAYVKEIEGEEVEIEFLTDTATRNDKTKNVSIAGIIAQPLDYLTLSLHTTMDFQTYSGEKGKVVSPEAWIFHKGLTFIKRKDDLKRLKDLYGIWYVATQLGDFSEQAIERFKKLARENSSWFNTFQNNIQNWTDDASPREWLNLEAQDPSGNLKQLNFKKITEKICKLDK
jgi:hypothetical protein